MRQGVAISPSATESILDQLREDDDQDVKNAVAYRELPEQWSPKELELLYELKEQRTTNPRKDWLRLARL